jgi:Periplasmic protease
MYRLVGDLPLLFFNFVPCNELTAMSGISLFSHFIFFQDLDQGYVDDVDTRKLFETGVSAMLKSLDPYTEFEGKQEASDLNESVSGKYGGIGLVISGTNIPPKPAASSLNSISSDNNKGNNKNKILPNDAVNDNMRLLDDDTIALDDDGEEDEDLLGGLGMSNQALSQKRREDQKAYEKAVERGIRVVNAFEGYAFDYGMRPGDKLVAVDDWRIEPGTSVEEVRNRLRGEPGSTVDITFQRDGVEGENKVTIPRTVVQIADVKLATMIGDPKDGIGYIQLSGFSADAGREVRNAIFALQQVAENASNGNQSLQVRTLVAFAFVNSSYHFMKMNGNSDLDSFFSCVGSNIRFAW